MTTARMLLSARLDVAALDVVGLDVVGRLSVA
jgi:hypothetical protein